MDAGSLLGGRVVTFEHREPADIARIVRRLGRGTELLLLSDGLFSHDGGLAPLHEHLNVLPVGSLLVVDDAHGAGTIGETGCGTVEVCGVPTGQIVQTISLSKAFGVYGGAILGTRELVRTIFARSRIFGGNTPLPLPFVCGALKSLKLLQTDKRLRARLRANTAFIKDALARSAFEQPNTPSPIISIVPKSSTEMRRIKNSLIARGIFPPLIEYPRGSGRRYFRFAISSEHTFEQLERLIEALLPIRR